MVPIFSKNGLAINAGILRCFHFDSLTYEYKRWSDEYISVGSSLPMFSTEIDPGIEIIGKVSVFNGHDWEMQEDHRGEVVYSIVDSSAVTVDYIGIIKNGFVTAAPVARHDKWNGSEWVADKAEQHSEDIEVATQFKRLLIEEAKSAIAPLQGAIKLNMATDDEVKEMVLWKQYWTLLLCVDVNMAPDIDWPDKPKRKRVVQAKLART